MKSAKTFSILIFFKLLFCRNIEGKVIEIGQLQEVFQEKVLAQVYHATSQACLYHSRKCSDNQVYIFCL